MTVATYALTHENEDVKYPHFRRWCYNRYRLKYMLEHDVQLADVLFDALDAKSCYAPGSGNKTALYVWEKEYRETHDLGHTFPEFMKDEYADRAFMNDLLGHAHADLVIYVNDPVFTEGGDEPCQKSPTSP